MIKNCQARIYIRLEDKLNQDSLRSTATMRFKNHGARSELEMTFFSPLGTRLAKLQITPSEALWIEASKKISLKHHPLFTRFIDDRWWEKFGFIFGILPSEEGTKVSSDDSSKSKKLINGKNEIECEYLTPSRVKQCKIEFSDLTGLLELNQYKCES